MPAKIIRKKKANPKEVETELKGESVLDKLEDDLERDGIILPGKDNIDDDYLILPQHLDATTSKEIGRYLHALSQQRVWIRTLILRVKAVVREKNGELDKIRKDIYSSQPTKMSVTEKELMLLDDKKATTILDEVNYLQSKYEMLEGCITSLEELIFDVSREITRRGSDEAIDGRVYSVHNKRKG